MTREAEIHAMQQRIADLEGKLIFIRDYIDKHSCQHFVEFTNDNPDIKAWRRSVDAVLLERKGAKP